MARDMWTMINRELAKIESARGGVSATPVLDTFAETMKYAERDRERQRIRKEERSEDSMKIMALQAGSYNTNYDNASLDVNIKRLENYVAKNKGKFDATAMDYYDVTLNGLRDQKALNIDFKSYQERLPSIQEDMNEYIMGLDKDKAFTAENITKLEEMQAPLVKFTGEFRAKHGERLQSKAYEDYNLQLGHLGEMNSFLIQSAHDDGFLREDEMNAYMTDMRLGNTKASDRHSNLEDVKKNAQIKQLGANMNQSMAEITMLKEFKAGKGSMLDPEDPSGEALINWKYATENMSPGEIATYTAEIDQKIDSAIDKAEGYDKSYQRETAKGSYFDVVAPDLLSRPKPSKKPPTVKPAAAAVKIKEGKLMSPQSIQKELTRRQQDLGKLKQAKKQGGSYLDRALKNLGHESIENLEKEIIDISKEKVKIPAMKYVKKQLEAMGQITGDMTIEKWIEGHREEWEKLVDEEHKKRSLRKSKYRE